MKNYIIYLLLFSTASVCGQTNYKQIFKKYGTEGSTVIYNQNKRTWLFTDSLDAMRETLPLSTFNIVNAGIALEMGSLKTETEIIKGGTNHSDLKTAFRQSSDWFFQELAKKTDRKDYVELLKDFDYGNHTITQTGNDFWNKGTLKISPKEQIQFLRYFMRESLSFSPRTYRILKELMLAEKTSSYQIFDQSGGNKSGDNNSWYIGAVYLGDNVFYFATRITKSLTKTSTGNNYPARAITMEILKNMKVIK